MAKKKPPGHYCRICGCRKPNEKFSGKGHAGHICKECYSLPQEKKNELQYINRIDRIAEKYPRSREDWEYLEKCAKNKKYPEAAEFAQMILGMSGRGVNEPIEKGCENDGDIYDYADIDNLPVFSEKKKFAGLDDDEKKWLRDYIRSEIIEHWEHSNVCPNENELVEIRKRMTGIFEEECHIILKNDATLRKFFQDNVTSAMNKLQKKTEVSVKNS
ncbi:hypothetical protein [Dysgonomonas termitidis]|uniref:DUF4428 domain-containing protein n=1 Tax=Dysgonomonas termitidis TaxID=1516126 RepID=A0ABV9L3J6_9BACT|nr:hypothetical protein AGMMS49574_16140 [Bacteroidia bacterium]GHV15023.1 hypothetical protein FACS1894169_05240 [Bacteroidia bacterium]